MNASIERVTQCVVAVALAAAMTLVALMIWAMTAAFRMLG